MNDAPDLVWRLNVNSDAVTAEYLEHVLSSSQLRRAITDIASGTSESMRKINKRTISTVQVPVPSRGEQEIYLHLVQPLAQSVEMHEGLTKSLTALRSSIVDNLLSGEHEIPESYDELLGV